MKLFVTGTKGQVVSALIKRGGREDLDVIACGRPELDLEAPVDITRLIAESGADVVVSAAAYTAVDKAEDDADKAFAVNRDGPGALAKAAAELDLPIIHISTDYVFDGTKTDGAYSELEPTSPVSVYGKSKLAGEQTVAEHNPRHVILRTAWVYSETGGNFLKTILRVGALRDELGVVADQFGAPTHANAIAAGIIQVAKNVLRQPNHKDLVGVFHMSCSGSTNWHGFAEAIFKSAVQHGGPKPKVNAIMTADYPTPAKRPLNSRLDCSKIQQVHGLVMPHWKEMVESTVGAVLSESGL